MLPDEGCARPRPRPEIFNRSGIQLAPGRRRAEESTGKEATGENHAQDHVADGSNHQDRIVSVFAAIEGPPPILFLDSGNQRKQNGGRRAENQDKEEAGSGFPPTFPDVHESSLRTKCRKSSRKPSGQTSRMLAPLARSCAANCSALRATT